jgi:hypothetical protein
MPSRPRVVFVLAAALIPALFGTASALPTEAINGQGNRSGLEQDVGFLASDALQGRDNQTAGSTLAQNYLIDQLRHYAVGANTSATGDDAFKQAIPGGTNIVGMIPGAGSEFVVVGAHYDHLGNGCRHKDPLNQICNGATDNAAGVANVLSIGRELAQRPGALPRTVVLAFWDREEDGLLGSQFYVNHPLMPLAQTAAYVNYDIQGANLLPSLRRDTFAVGAESGGAPLQSIVRSAAQRGPIDTHLVSSIFGQGRSDYVNFIAKSVPTVFYSDSTGGCYHTTQDELGVVDFWKLRFQAKIGLDTVQSLVNGPRVPFVSDNPLATYDDALALLPIVNNGIADEDLFSGAAHDQLLTFHDDVNRIVAEGRANFDDDDVITLLTDAGNAINNTTTLDCDGFLKPGK